MRAAGLELHLEELTVARLNLDAQLLDGGRIVAHHLDLRQRLSSGLFLGERVYRSHTAIVNGELLALRREHVALQKARSIRVRRCFEDGIGSDDERASLRRVDEL